MIYRITSSKDATIYEDDLDKNTGLDQILEIRKYLSGSTYYSSRILIKFDLDEISSLIDEGSITSPIFNLNMYVTDANEIPLEYTIYGYMVSESWEMGVGKYLYSPAITDGVSWQYKDFSDGIEWLTSSWVNGTTGSDSGGGQWYTGSVVSQSFNYEKADIQMNITNVINNWLSGLFENDGLILKFSDSDENNNESLGSIKFFSKDTQTIYQPTLEIRWDDSSYETSSLLPVISGNILLDDINITMRRMRPKYHLNEKVRFRINPRELYPVRTFATSSVSMDIKYLPTSSYYSVVDINSGLEIIPFDTNYTKISCDSNGNYFNLWMDQFDPERYYKFLFKVVDNGYERIFENRYMFEVID
jgi:hypothetical protein